LESDVNKEASGPLAIIQAVINTRYSRTRLDEWNNPEQVRAWLLHPPYRTAPVFATQPEDV
jgi:hypothetical protein